MWNNINPVRKEMVKHIVFTGLLFILIFSMMIIFIEGTKQTIPAAFELSSSRQSGLSLEQVNRVSESGVKVVSFGEKGNTTLRYGDKSQLARLIYTSNGDLSELFPLQLEYGVYFISDSSVSMNSKSILIDKNLSQEFFFTPNGVGQILKIEGEDYTVCGVFSYADSLLSQMCTDGRSVVFLPYSSSNKEETVQHVFMKGEQLQSTDNCIELLASVSNQKPYFTYSVNHSETRTFFESGIVNLLFLFFLFLGVTAVTWGWKQYPRIKKDLIEKSNIHRFWRISIAVIWFILSVIGLNMFPFSLSLPTVWIPQDNIFDLGFYIDQYVNGYKQYNSGMITSFYHQYSLFATALFIIFALFSLFLLIVLFVEVERLIIKRVDE